MIEDRDLFERAAQRFAPPEDSFERFLDRRDRKVRNRRIAAAAVGIAISVALAVAFTAASLLRSELRPADETPTPLPFHNGEIVMVRGLFWRDDTDPELFAVDPGTGAVRHLVSCDQECSPGTWSPDGTELLYSSGGHLYRLDAETGSSHVVVSGRGVTGAFSPEGERIVYEAGRPPIVPSSFFLMSRDGSRLRELEALAGLNIGWYQWSPDGRSIAYWEHGVHFSDSSIHLLELNGSSPARTLVSFPREDPCNPQSAPLGCVHSVAMNPVDGRIAYATFEPEQAFDGTTRYAAFEVKEGTDRIHVIDPNDGTITIVDTLPAMGVPGDLPSVLAWSPDGSRIAFAAGCRIWSIAPDSTDRELLVDLGSCAATPDQLTWSPDGTELAFLELNRNAAGVLKDVTLAVLTIDGAAVRTLGTFDVDDTVRLAPMAWQSIPIRHP